jgi:hypothetical protein
MLVEKMGVKFTTAEEGAKCELQCVDGNSHEDCGIFLDAITDDTIP